MAPRRLFIAVDPLQRPGYIDDSQEAKDKVEASMPDWRRLRVTLQVETATARLESVPVPAPAPICPNGRHNGPAAQTPHPGSLAPYPLPHPAAVPQITAPPVLAASPPHWGMGGRAFAPPFSSHPHHAWWLGASVNSEKKCSTPVSCQASPGQLPGASKGATPSGLSRPLVLARLRPVATRATGG